MDNGLDSKAEKQGRVVESGPSEASVPWQGESVPEFRTSEPVYFGTTRGEYGKFTNFARIPVEIDGRTWVSTEHYYQAQKVIVGDPARADEISRQATPRDAAHLGRMEGQKQRADWLAVRDDVMRVAVSSKILQHADIADTLVGTGARLIVERSSKDSYWGDGPNGDGQNKLGKILMEIREILTAQRHLVGGSVTASLEEYCMQARSRY